MGCIRGAAGSQNEKRETGQEYAFGFHNVYHNDELSLERGFVGHPYLMEVYPVFGPPLYGQLLMTTIRAKVE